MTVLAVAALSARALSEAAARDGYQVIALDPFGDQDTLRACAQWLPIGAPDELRIDGAKLLDALAGLARRGDVLGWVAGSGFEGEADLLARGAALLPLIGTAAQDVRRVRDPQRFFACLDAHRIAHPDVRHSAPGDPLGWLVKEAGGCGGRHLRHAAAARGRPLPSGAYFQREMPGVPMSATFIANGRDARVLGFNRQIVRPVGAQPFVFCGVVGPVALDGDVAQRVDTMVRKLAAAFSLRGLGSLDFLLDGDRVLVLEVNPRPPASFVLYPDCGGLGPLAAHVQACRSGELPALPALPAPKAARGAALRGSEIVFARRSFRLDRAGSDRLAAWAGCHDLPHADTVFMAGDPVCSVAAGGASLDEVLERMANHRDGLLTTLENRA